MGGLQSNTCCWMGLGVVLGCEENSGTENESWSKEEREGRTDKVAEDADAQSVLLGGMPWRSMRCRMDDVLEWNVL